MRNNQGRRVLAFEADGERREFCREQTHLSATGRPREELQYDGDAGPYNAEKQPPPASWCFHLPLKSSDRVANRCRLNTGT